MSLPLGLITLHVKDFVHSISVITKTDIIYIKMMINLKPLQKNNKQFQLFMAWCDSPEIRFPGLSASWPTMVASFLNNTASGDH